MAERRIADIGPLLEDLKKELKDLEGSTEALTVEEAAEDEIEELKSLPVIDPERMIPAWRDPDKDPPKVETEVLVLYRYNGYMGITTKRVYAIFAGCDQGRVYLLHRCDRSRVCVCDFIGFEVQEDGNQ